MKDYFVFESLDVNDDGVDEIWVSEITVGGAQNHPSYLFRTNPLECILGDSNDGIWSAKMEMQNAIYMGYHDLKSWNHHSYDDEPTYIFRWNGVKYE